MTAADRMKALRDRKIAQGLRQVLVWVPAERAEEIRRIAEGMRLKMRFNQRLANARKMRGEQNKSESGKFEKKFENARSGLPTET